MWCWQNVVYYTREFHIKRENVGITNEVQLNEQYFTSHGGYDREIESIQHCLFFLL